jgi:hypothetical protein
MKDVNDYYDKGMIGNLLSDEKRDEVLRNTPTHFAFSALG